MGSILAGTLKDMRVMRSDGTEFGEVYNLTMDLATGGLVHLIVDPDDANAPYDTDLELDGHGRFLVPMERITAIRDYIIFER
jgi:sporulation protein YlmC with PRC-barrel domain